MRQQTKACQQPCGAQVMDDYSSKSFRLLAMAMGVIPNAAGLDFARMTQHQVEACAVHMNLLSLVVLTNNVRSDSKDTIAHLQPTWSRMIKSVL